MLQSKGVAKSQTRLSDRSDLILQIKKQRHYFVNKGPLVKAMFFAMGMYGCESWTVKKAERRRIDVFELWCWRRLLESLGQQRDPTSPT